MDILLSRSDGIIGRTFLSDRFHDPSRMERPAEFQVKAIYPYPSDGAVFTSSLTESLPHPFEGYG